MLKNRQYIFHIIEQIKVYCCESDMALLNGGSHSNQNNSPFNEFLFKSCLADQYKKKLKLNKFKHLSIL